MSRKAQVFVLVLVLSIGSVLLAGDFGLKEHDLSVSFEAYSFKYKEPGLMEETGVLGGIVGKYTYRSWLDEPEKTIKPMIRGEARYAAGSVDYDGAYLSGEPFSYDGINDRVFEGRGMVGLDMFVCRDKVLLTPYAGIGYRQLNDQASAMPGGYDRRSQYLYVPLGCDFVLASKGDWLLSFNTEYDLFIEGQQRSELSGLHPALPDVDNDQNGGNGFRASVRLDNEKHHFFLEPYVRMWWIDESERQEVFEGGYFFEPENETVEIGMNAGFRF